MPTQFCGAIVLIFFLELAVAVLAFLFQDWVRDRFREFFESNIRSYRDDIDLQNLIDSLQKAVSSAPGMPPARACPFPPLVTLGCPAAEMGTRPSRLRVGFLPQHGREVWSIPSLSLVSLAVCSASGMAVQAPSQSFGSSLP